MRKWSVLVGVYIIILITCTQAVNAQCSICTKTAGQLGEKPASGLNTGIVYLMLAPFAVVGYIGYRWWKTEHSNEN